MGSMKSDARYARVSLCHKEERPSQYTHKDTCQDVVGDGSQVLQCIDHRNNEIVVELDL
jgi:hypothetical protein